MDHLTKAAGVVRHVVSGLGGLFVGLGIANADEVSGVLSQIEVIGGAIAFVAGTVASILARSRA